MRKVVSSLVRLAIALVAVMGLLAVVVPADAAIDSATTVQSPNSSPTEDNSLNSVSCVSVSWCVAVGHYDDAGVDQTMVQFWDGTGWSIQPSPNSSPTEDNDLQSVECETVSWCVAVGRHDDAGVDRTMVQFWDGTGWSIQPSPNSSPTEDNGLYSVSCTSTSHCVAVGEYFDGNYIRTLVEVWDGTGWSIQPSPNTSPTETNYLFSVSCVTPSSCVAAGAYFVSGWNQTMIQRWDGSSWTIQPSPSTSTTEDNWLESVSCVSESSCVAVGAHTIANGTIYRSMVQVWDGSSWSTQPSPNSSNTDSNYLFSVSCVSASFCVAVGHYADDFDSSILTFRRTLVEVWDGSSWSIQQSPNPDPAESTLDEVTCVSDSQCIAVGNHGSGAKRTLVLSLSGPEPPTTTTTAIAPDPVVPSLTG